MQNIIELKDICFSVNKGKYQILKNINLQIPYGQYLAIKGPSGSGKSSLINILGCLNSHIEGEYILNNKNISRLNDYQKSIIRNRYIGFVFQSFNLIENMTVFENIELALIYKGEKKQARKRIINSLLSDIGLTHKAYNKAKDISGGQMQRVAIARALACGSDLILADEPTGNLDSATTLKILDLFDRLHKKGATIVMITHEEDVASRAERQIIIEDGRITRDFINEG